MKVDMVFLIEPACGARPGIIKILEIFGIIGKDV